MRGTGAEQLVLAMKRLKGCGAKGLRHLDEIMSQPLWGGTHEFGKGL